MEEKTCVQKKEKKVEPGVNRIIGRTPEIIWRNSFPIIGNAKDPPG